MPIDDERDALHRSDGGGLSTLYAFIAVFFRILWLCLLRKYVSSSTS